MSYLQILYGNGSKSLLTQHLSTMMPVLYISLNLSQVLALYSLASFYCEFREELSPHRPLGKFVAVKSIIFMSFW